MAFHPRAAVAVAVLGLVGLELLLQHRFGFGRAPVLEPDARLGWRWIPGQRVVGRRGILTAINSAGYRDREWPAEDAPDALRVAVFGDSVIHGVGVPVELAAFRLLEEALAAATPERPVVVRSYAVGKYSFELMARTYEDEARSWAPHFSVFVLDSSSARPVPPTRDPVDHPLRRPLAKLALTDWFHRSLLPRVRGAPIESWRAHDAFGPEQQAELAALAAHFPLTPYAAETAPLWEAMRARLAEIAHQARGHGGEVVVVALPRFDEVLRTDAVRHGVWLAEQSRHVAGLHFLEIQTAFAEASAGLRRALEARGADPSVLVGRRRLPPELAGVAADLLHMPHDLQHFSPRGHRLLADLVAKELTKLMTPPRQ